jgi:phosphoribosylglycinamide formyltransferase-1
MIDHVRMRILQNVDIRLLVTNIIDAPAASLARENSIPTAFVEGVYGRKFASKQEMEEARTDFDWKVVDLLRDEGIDLIALAGFMQVLGGTLVDAYRYRIMNIHPAKDLARFGGRGMFGERVHAAVISAGEKESGCTVHYVDNSIDGGPPILQAAVPVDAADTPETLAHRILIHEHRTYSKAIQLHVDDRIRVQEGKAIIDWSGDWENQWNQRQEAFVRYQNEQQGSHEQLLQQST